MVQCSVFLIYSICPLIILTFIPLLLGPQGNKFASYALNLTQCFTESPTLIFGQEIDLAYNIYNIYNAA